MSELFKCRIKIQTDDFFKDFSYFFQKGELDISYCPSDLDITHFRLNRLPVTIYWKSFNFRYVRLCDLDISREKWLKILQTVKTPIRCHILGHLI